MSQPGIRKVLRLDKEVSISTGNLEQWLQCVSWSAVNKVHKIGKTRDYMKPNLKEEKGCILHEKRLSEFERTTVCINHNVLKQLQ